MNTLPEFIKGITTAKDNASIAQRREFVIKTNRNAFNWQSAYAILELEKIIKNAVPMTGESVFVPVKNTGNPKAHKYVNMALLYYTFTNVEKDYMNFTVRLTLGIKRAQPENLWGVCSM